ncbi:MAG: FlgD immunoglobulin-like domain containing protein [Chitinophagales bacterium]|nr:lamin tail domain-containing protein [Bacteroidota bacterium]
MLTNFQESKWLRTLLLYVLICFSLPVWAQFQDDFSDGNITQNPQWSGNTESFIVNSSQQLQLNAAAAGTAILTTPSAVMDNTEWQFYFDLKFSPSNNNFTKIYLCSDNADLSGSLNGYFLRIGENGSEDAVKLFRQDGLTETLLLTSAINVAVNPAMRVKVLRTDTGDWTLFLDPTGGDFWQNQGTINDNTYNSTAFFGIYAAFTSSNVDKFFYDDFYVGDIIVDTQAPQIESVNNIGQNIIEVVFDESIDPNSLQNAANFSIQGIGSAENVVVVGGNTIWLYFSENLPEQNLSLTANNVTDLSGNTNASQTFSFDNGQTIVDLALSLSSNVSVAVVGGIVQLNVSLQNTTPEILATGVSVGLNIPANFSFVSAQVDLGSYSETSNVWTIGNIPLGDETVNLTLQLQVVSENDAATCIAEILSCDQKDTDSTPADNNGSTNVDDFDDEDSISISLLPEGTAVFDLSLAASLNITTISLSEVSHFNISLFNNSNEIANNVVVKIFIPTELSVSNVTNSTGNYNTQLQEWSISQVNAQGNAVLDLELQPSINGIYTLAAEIQSADGVDIDSTPNNYNVTQGPAEDDEVQEILVVGLPMEINPFDVLITEIFANPAGVPDVEMPLPEAEYVELFNRTENIINLENFTFSDASSDETLSTYYLLPGQYIILCKTADVPLFEPFGEVMGISLPSLNNSGDVLSVHAPDGQLIHQVIYDESWYQDAVKAQGGWSLEMIDTDNPCSGKTNWHASENYRGGTPGHENSVKAANPDTTPPTLVRGTLLKESQIVMLFFDETLDAQNILESYFTVDKGIGNPLVALSDGAYIVTLIFENEFLPQEIYTLTISSQISDCSGNTMAADAQVRLGLSEMPEAGDIVINEILSNPVSGNVDFIELVNISDKILDLSNMFIANGEVVLGNTVAVDAEKMSTVSYLLFPQDYVVLTENPELVLQQYETPNPNDVYEIADLPTYDDNEGIVIVTDEAGNFLDIVPYTRDWYSPLISDKNGVSLERISFEGASDKAANWHSAAASVGFATPAYKNSQSAPNVVSSDLLSVSPSVITPNNDGYRDFLLIQLNLEEAAQVADVKIYDMSGREIKHLVKDEIQGFSATYQWDGTDNDGNKALPGIYVVYAETFSTSGSTNHYKTTCTVGGE